MDRSSLRTSLLYEASLVGVLFLAFLWLITRFVEAIYTFGLLGVDIPPEVASAALLLTPLALLLVPGLLAGRAAGRSARLTAALALFSLGSSLLLAPRERMLVTGLGTGLMLLCLPAALASGRLSATGLGCGLVLAGLASMALRAFNHGSDLMTGPLAIGINLLVAVIGGVLLFGFHPVETVPAAATRRARFWPTAGRYLGLTGGLVLLYFGFATPAVIARWTGASYPWVYGAVMGSLILFGVVWFGFPGLRARLTVRVLLVWAGLFVVTLAVALLSFQVRFPADPAAYPLDAPQPGPLVYVVLAVSLLLHPVIYAAMARLGDALMAEPPTPRVMAGSAALASLFLLVMIFAHVFTTVYDYIPIVGPLFRDRFWLVTVLPGLVMALALWVSRPPAPDSRRAAPLLALVFVLALLPVLLPTRQAVLPQESGLLRVMTYNIQQGYNTQGEKVYADLLDRISSQAPDILGIQESDTARIANGNNDVIRYLADGLAMHVYYGPTSVTGTFGIALLSRYPIENPRTFYMASSGEQTASILATIRVNGQACTVLVTHLGNGGPLIQQQQVLARLAGQPNIIAMGDFNFYPSTEQYTQTVTVLSDAWEISHPHEVRKPEDVRRIDHVFLSPDIPLFSATYLPEGLSDHPALVVELAP